MQTTWSIAGWLLVALSAFHHWKGDREWGYRYYLLALLNWIVYYLAMGKA